MEQKKLLWIIFSVTLFLVVVVGAGFIWFYPEDSPSYVKETAPKGRKAETQTDFDPIEWVRTEEEYPGFGEEKEEKDDEGFVVVYGENGEEKPSEGEQTSDSEKDETSDGEKSSGISVQEEDGGADRVAEKPRARSKPATAKTAEASEDRGKSYSGTKKTIRTVEYWIQAGSYTSKTRAEKVQDRLDGRGFAGRVVVKEIDGITYYRVRIGPYRNKGEADKFLNWVKDIKDFEKSYVSKVYSSKVVRE